MAWLLGAGAVAGVLMVVLALSLGASAKRSDATLREMSARQRERKRERREGPNGDDAGGGQLEQFVIALFSAV